MIESLETLHAIWFAVLAFVLVIYSLTDGFDLGVGILSLFAKDEEQRGIMMGSLGTVWDANETWLVLFGGVLFGAFPIVYGIFARALYIPLVLMLVGLIFRAVSFEFRPHADNQRVWSTAFGAGSLLAAACQGFALGGAMSGLKIEGTTYVGGVFPWVNLFALMVVLTLISVYTLLGSTYLIMKTEGKLQQLGYKGAAWSIFSALLFALGALIWAAIRYEFVRETWFSQSPLFLVTVIPMILSAVCIGMILVSLAQRRERAPFFWTMGFVAAAFVALGASYYPYVLPPELTASEAAAQPLTMRVMLVALLIFLPILIGYNLYMYWIFRGKVRSNLYDEH
jgi:cytochrome d ubiquinol oxidase subunit II